MDEIHGSASALPGFHIPVQADGKVDSGPGNNEFNTTESFTPAGVAGEPVIDMTAASKTLLGEVTLEGESLISFSPNCSLNMTPVPLLGAGDLLFTSGEKGFAAFNVQDGEIWWMRETEGYYNYPVNGALTPDGSRLFYVDGNDATMTAVNPSTGERAWKFNCPHGPRLTPPAMSPDGGKVFFGDNDTLFAVDSSSGDQVWGKKFHMNITTAATLSPDGKTLYVCDSHSTAGKDHLYESTLFAIDPETGEDKWKCDLGGQSACDPVTGRDGTVYVGDKGGTIYAINGESGKILWKDRKNMDGPLGDAISLVISPDGRTLYGTAEDNLEGGRTFALDIHKTPGRRFLKKPKTLWEHQGAVVHSPALSPDGSTLYVGSDDKKLRAFNAKDGILRWESPTPGRAYSPAVSADGSMLYVVIGNDDSNPGKEATMIAVSTGDGQVQSFFQKDFELAGLNDRGRDDIVFCPRDELRKKLRQSLDGESGRSEITEEPAIQREGEFIVIDGVKLPIETSSSDSPT